MRCYPKLATQFLFGSCLRAVWLFQGRMFGIKVSIKWVDNGNRFSESTWMGYLYWPLCGQKYRCFSACLSHVTGFPPTWDLSILLQQVLYSLYHYCHFWGHLCLNTAMLAMTSEAFLSLLLMSGGEGSAAEPWLRITALLSNSWVWHIAWETLAWCSRIILPKYLCYLHKPELGLY